MLNFLPSNDEIKVTYCTHLAAPMLLFTARSLDGECYPSPSINSTYLKARRKRYDITSAVLELQSSDILALQKITPLTIMTSKHNKTTSTSNTSKSV